MKDSSSLRLQSSGTGYNQYHGSGVLAHTHMSARLLHSITSPYDPVRENMMSSSASEVTTIWRYTNVYIIIIIIIIIHKKQKYITYYNANRRGSSHVHRQHKHKIWCKVWMCGSRDMLTFGSKYALNSALADHCVHLQTKLPKIIREKATSPRTPKTTTLMVHELSHNYATNSPLVTWGDPHSPPK